jgi:hypothetical protein
LGGIEKPEGGRRLCVCARERDRESEKGRESARAREREAEREAEREREREREGDRRHHVLDDNHLCSKRHVRAQIGDIPHFRDAKIAWIT